MSVMEDALQPSFPTHDVSHVGAHVPNGRTVRELLQTLADKGSRQQGRYSEVHVLLISWEGDGSKARGELQGLEIVFTESFNYDVETWEIPQDKPQRRLRQRVIQFVEKYESNRVNSLLILCYSGHAVPAGGGPMWTPRQNPDPKISPQYPKISPQCIPVEDLLAECDSDALLLYDCCFATSISTSVNTSRVTEAMAACGFHEAAPGADQGSFTKALTHELKIISSSSIPISVGELYGRLVSRLWRDAPNITFDKGGSRPDKESIFEVHRRRIPIFYPISNEQNRRNILLAPLPSKESESTSLALGVRATGEAARQGGGTMVLLSIRVDSEDADDLTWRDWLQDIPTEATSITVQGTYRGYPAIVVLTMPTETWSLLPSNAAYSFMGFVTSPNLTSVSPG